MNTLDETHTDETTDEVTEDTNSENSGTVDKTRQKRISELRNELQELESEPELSEVIDTDVAEVTDAVDESAETVAKEVKDGETDVAEVTQAAQVEAEQIADEAEQAGVTFSATEVDAIADRIVDKVMAKVEAKLSEKKDKPTERKPDRKPKSTHFSERRLWGKGKGE